MVPEPANADSGIKVLPQRRLGGRKDLSVIGGYGVWVMRGSTAYQILYPTLFKFSYTTVTAARADSEGLFFFFVVSLFYELIVYSIKNHSTTKTLSSMTMIESKRRQPVVDSSFNLFSLHSEPFVRTYYCISLLGTILPPKSFLQQRQSVVWAPA